MSVGDWQRVKEILADALMREAGARAAFLDQACRDDADLRREVESLLASHERAGEYLSRGPGIDPERARAVLEHGEQARRIGPYRVVDVIARGGMGTVYRAVRDDDAFQKAVALKLVRAGGGSEYMERRFRQERHILARLQHPNIATILDGGATEDGQPYLVMEHVEGRPITAYCDEHGLTTRERLALFGPVCAAVQYAHQNLVVHRDLKPDNILVTADGTPKLLDFGIAKLLAAGVDPETAPTATLLPMMTPEYASPEQVRGEAVTTASDVYSLGVLLYELLAGRRPYAINSESLEDIVRTVCQTEPPPPSAATRTRALKGDLDTIVMKALRKQPTRRYASAHELAEDIRRYLEGLPVRARADTLRYRARKFVGRHRTAVAAAALVVLALIAGLAATWREARIAEANRRRAERRFNDVRKLASFVMFDMHDAVAKLPGSTGPRKQLVDEALAYLDSLASEAGGDASLQRELAAGYEKMGDVLGWPSTANLGDVPGALAAWRKAQAARQRLLAAEPGNAEVLRDVSTTAQKIGRALYQARDPAGGIEEAHKASLIEEGLAARDSSPRQMFRLAKAYANEGFLLKTGGRTVPSLDRLAQAVGLLETLSAANPADVEIRARLAATYSYQVLTLKEGIPVPGKVPDLAAALAVQRKAVAIDDSLAAAAASDPALQRQWMIDRNTLGGILLDMGDLGQARDMFAQGLARAEALARADAANLQAQKDVAWSAQRLGMVLAKEGKGAEALVLLDRARRLFQPILDAHPDNLQTQAMIAATAIGMGHAHVALASGRARPAAAARPSHWLEARARFEEARAIFDELRAKGLIAGDGLILLEEAKRGIARCDAALAADQARAKP